MSSVTGAGRPGNSTSPTAGDEEFGLGPSQVQNPFTTAPGAPRGLTFTALDGLRGLAVPFVLAFALRADIAALNPPVAVQHLIDGGYVLVNLFFVLVGFLVCRPLTTALAGAGGGDLFRGLFRRIAPLHLLAWVITFAWVATGPVPGTRSDWLFSAALLNGPFGPVGSGYPVSWSVSIAFLAVILLTITGLAVTALFRRFERIGAKIAPGRLVTGIAVTAGAIGTVLLVVSSPEAVGTVGLAAGGQGLLGIGTGMLAFRVLEGATGSLASPKPGTVPRVRPVPGLGALLAITTLLFCVYRSDLVHELDLLPLFPPSAALVYFLALPSSRGAVNRLLDARPLQWLGARALALYLLHGPVQLMVERICELRGLDRTSPTVTYAVLGAVVLGSLVAADLGHRLLERALAPAAPVPTPAISMYRVPHSRPERIAQIDREAIPSELRLKPLPRPSSAKPTRKTAAAKAVAAKPAAAKKAPAVKKPTRKIAAKSVELPADEPNTTVELPTDKPARRSATRKSAAKAATPPIDLDRPPVAPGSEHKVLDADADTLDADA